MSPNYFSSANVCQSLPKSEIVYTTLLPYVHLVEYQRDSVNIFGCLERSFDTKIPLCMPIQLGRTVSRVEYCRRLWWLVILTCILWWQDSNRSDKEHGSRPYKHIFPTSELLFATGTVECYQCNQAPYSLWKTSAETILESWELCITILLTLMYCKE